MAKVRHRSDKYDIAMVGGGYGSGYGDGDGGGDGDGYGGGYGNGYGGGGDGGGGVVKKTIPKSVTDINKFNEVWKVHQCTKEA
jgi:hypothetical protein